MSKTGGLRYLPSEGLCALYCSVSVAFIIIIIIIIIIIVVVVVVEDSVKVMLLLLHNRKENRGVEV